MDVFHCIRCGKWYLLLYGEATARECYPLIRNGFLAGRVLFSNNVAIDGVHTIVPLLKRNDYEKILAKLMAFIAVIVVFASCSKSSDSPSNPTSGGSYPKTVNVEYRVTATSGNPSGNVSIQHQGDNDYDQNKSLPYSRKYTLTINKNESLFCGFTAYVGGAVRIDILVNGTVVKTQTASGTTLIDGSAFYMFQ